MHKVFKNKAQGCSTPLSGQGINCAPGGGGTHLLRQRRMCRSNGSLFYQKSLNMGPVFFYKKKKQQQQQLYKKLFAFPEGFSDQTRYISRLLQNIKHYNQLKKNWKIIFGLENRGETLFFMSRHFDQTMTILTSHFLHFGALVYWWLFCDKNKQNNIFKTKHEMFYWLFQYFHNTFLTACFPNSFVQGGVQMAYGEITY